ncbi:ArsR/SmtB family transcription factor [Nitrosopumilus ureiphilus]|uniref:ArsR family transcriptional regulator n=1 Tax=Nitrosopumilus ureiphilus TaxID=1470067 RepID=A0A7D5RFY7_9ARCH|nr:winged helix-turn-helix domain-containing protein [Nitrosopumilus ureiphilus]QLH06145.1 ArsR family transcriptional regulator [Nitrosopumilus ureiphilus]
MSNKDSEDKVEVISTNDDKIKLVGEIFSNDSSRKILKLISDNEMTANEIAQKNDMSLTLTIHHLKRMQKAKMIKISKTGISAKGQEMKYYVATNQSFLITPEKSNYSIINSLKKFSKFAAIGMAGFVSWMTLKHGDGNYQMQQSGQDDFIVDVRSTVDESDTQSSSEPLPEVNLEDSNAERTPRPESEPTQIPESESPHTDVENFDFSDSGAANTGSVSLDRTVYPQSFDGAGVDSVEPLILSIIIPIGVVVGGILLERILTRWHDKRKQNKHLREES